MSLEVFLVFGDGVALVLIDLGVGPIQLYRLQKLLHLLILLRVHSIVQLFDEEVVVLLLCLLFVLLTERLEVLFALFEVWLCYQVKWRWHLLRDLRPLLYFAHGLAHLVFIWTDNSNDLVGCWNLTLTDLVGILHIVLQT